MDASRAEPGSRAIIHVDMDAFYASVEQRDRPELRGKPVVVGGDPRRGVVLAASYEARPFGVRSAMPMAEALRRSPALIVVPPRFEAYTAASEQVFAIFEGVTPLVEPLSLDEAFLDVTASQSLFGTPAQIARKIREEIAAATQLTASAGIAAIKMVAKIASDLAKPDGQREVPAAETQAFLDPLPLSRLWGVGPKTGAALAALGLRTIGELAAADPEWLERRAPGALYLHELARGIDARPVIPDRAAKSIGAEDTFDADCARGELPPLIHDQALRVGRRLRRAGVKARVAQLTIKLADFTLITRRTTLPEPTDDGQALYRAAIALLERVSLPTRVRLTGVSAQEIMVPENQLGLFAPAPTRADRLNSALDRITDRFGSAAIATADVAGGTDDRDPG